MQLRLAGTDGDAKHSRRFRMFVAIQPAQQQSVASALRQRLDRGLELLLFHANRAHAGLVSYSVGSSTGISRFEDPRRFSSTVFTAIRCNHVEKELRASNRGSAFQA